MTKILKDKVIVITGITGGLGEKIAEKCLEEGAIVAGTYINKKDKANELVNKGVKLIERVDVSSFNDVTAFLKVWKRGLEELTVL